MKKFIFVLVALFVFSVAVNIGQIKESRRQEQRAAEKDAAIAALQSQINDLGKGAEDEVVFKTATFKLLTMSDGIFIDLRERLVSQTVMYESGRKLGGSPTDDKRVDELASEFRAIDGFVGVYFSPYEIMITKASMFQKKELTERIIPILKEKFPESAPTTPNTQGNAGFVPTDDGQSLIQNAINAVSEK